MQNMQGNMLVLFVSLPLAVLPSCQNNVNRTFCESQDYAVILAHLTVRRCVARRRIRHGGDLQGGVICRRCNAKAVNLASGEVRCGEIGAVISSAETSEAVKCSAPLASEHIVSRPIW